MKKEHKEHLVLHLQEVIKDYDSSIVRRTKMLNSNKNNFNIDIEKKTKIAHTIAILLSSKEIFENCIEEIKTL